MQTLLHIWTQTGTISSLLSPPPLSDNSSCTNRVQSWWGSACRESRPPVNGATSDIDPQAEQVTAQWGLCHFLSDPLAGERKSELHTPLTQYPQSLKTANRPRVQPSCPHWPPRFRQTSHRHDGMSVLILVWALLENTDAWNRQKEEKSCWLHPVKGQEEVSEPWAFGNYRNVCLNLIQWFANWWSIRINHLGSLLTTDGQSFDQISLGKEFACVSTSQGVPKIMLQESLFGNHWAPF